jgi:hypothetical protein
VPRRRKGRAGQLLGVQTVRRLLWRVLTDGQSTRDGFGSEEEQSQNVSWKKRKKKKKKNKARLCTGVFAMEL